MTSILTVHFHHNRFIAGVAVVCALLGCSRKEKLKLPKDDVVLAKVAGQPITQYDVDLLARRTLGDTGGQGARINAQGKLLEGLIQSRAISMAAEKELTPIEKLALERELKSYKEQLLVRRYLDRHAPVAPVTAEMVAEYYRAHPERFGAKTVRRCELLGASRDLTPEERDTVMKSLREADRQRDWVEWSKALIKKGLPVSLTTTNDDDQLLDMKLLELLRSLKKPQVASPVAVVSGRPYIARVTGEEKLPPRPLADVRADIERLLAPGQLSTALEKVTKEARKSVEVEILKGAAPVRDVAPASSARRAP